MSHTASLTVALAALAYLVGSIPFGLLLTKAVAGRDVRRAGSGNIGAANVSRVAGYPAAVAVLILDAVKGLIPVLLGRTLGLEAWELALVGGIAVIGHDFSIFLRLRGGKGIATTVGVALGLLPPAGLIVAVIWLVILGIFRISSAASIIATLLLPVVIAILDGPAEYVALTFGLALLALYTHRDNLLRLSRGAEQGTGRAAGRD
ncbi:MAG TPA: glycerol-3-phosphate 1-O-acyltransferase PlsY [Chloroflexota bacterium]|nr:glycerol-3-phosphate 1-O-acyltransferase PlsY [Chloroflexota bacterium]